MWPPLAAGKAYILQRGILQDAAVQLTEDMDLWSQWMSDITNRRVGYSEIRLTTPPRRAPSSVFLTTTFLGFNLSGDPQEPVWFESQVLGGKYDECICFYATFEQAQQGHQLLFEAILSAESLRT
jgi:hypothetical protein